MERESSNECSVFFWWTKESVMVTKSSFEEFNNVFFPTKGKMFCFEIQRKEVKFLKTFQVRFLLYGQENYVFKCVLCNV